MGLKRFNGSMVMIDVNLMSLRKRNDQATVGVPFETIQRQNRRHSSSLRRPLSHDETTHDAITHESIIQHESTQQ